MGSTGGGRRVETLAEMRLHGGPNLVVLTRALRPPVPGLASLESELPDEVSGLPGSKAVVRGMSRKSSLNVARMLSAMDWGELGRCLHVTLTYHREWPADRRALDRAKQGLAMAFARNCEAAVWRLEFQTRKSPAVHYVPHFHVLAFLGDRDEGDFGAWVRRWWESSSGNGSPYACHITSGDQGRAGWYLAMHAAKREQSPPFAVGRWWGVANRSRLRESLDLFAGPVIVERERVWWARLYRRRTGLRTRQGAGFSWFLPRAWQSRVDVWVRDQVEGEALKRQGTPF